MSPTLRAAAVLLLPLALLTGCAGSPAPTSGGTTSQQPSSSSGSGGGAADVCALVPAGELEAVMGHDPGSGKATKGKVDGGQCTWKVSDTHTAIAQFSNQPDEYFPSSVFKKPKDGLKIAGADRGFAAASTHTVLVVKDGKGVLFTDINLSDKTTQDAYTALGKAILARL